MESKGAESGSLCGHHALCSSLARLICSNWRELDLLPHLRDIHVPAIIVAGSHDFISSPFQAWRLHLGMAGSKLTHRQSRASALAGTARNVLSPGETGFACFGGYMISSKPSLQEIAQRVEIGEGEAWADMFLAAPADFATGLGLQVERLGPAIALLTEKIDMMLFNRVIGLGVIEPASKATIETIMALYQKAGIQNFAVQLSPTAQPSTLPAWLEARGLHRRDNWAKVYRGVEAPPLFATDLRIDSIGPEQAALFARVACAAFGMPDSLSPWFASVVGRPGWRHYLAWDGDMPVATGALFVRDRVGWLGVGSTLPSHRRRGGQGAMMARRIRDGANLGCRWLITETGEDTPDHPNPSYRNMMRTGFGLAYQRPNYIF